MNFISEFEMSSRPYSRAFKMRRIEDNDSFDRDAVKSIELISVVAIIFLFWIIIASVIFPEGSIEVNGAIFG